MTDIPWNVRLDSSVDPVCVVFAPGWFEARGRAAMAMHFPPERLHVSQFNEREMREMLRAAPERELRMRGVQESTPRFSEHYPVATDHPPRCSTCGGTPHVSGLTCACGGTGLQRDEIDGLRKVAFEYEKELDWLNDTEHLEDVRWTMLNDDCSLREAVAKLRGGH